MLFPAGRRPELLAGPVIAAQLVVGGALFGILQDLVSLLHILELRFRVLLFAHVRMVLAGELSIGAFDLLGGGAAAHTQRVVVVLELHSIP